MDNSTSGLYYHPRTVCQNRNYPYTFQRAYLCGHPEEYIRVDLDSNSQPSRLQHTIVPSPTRRSNTTSSIYQQTLQRCSRCAEGHQARRSHKNPREPVRSLAANQGEVQGDEDWVKDGFLQGLRRQRFSGGPKYPVRWVHESFENKLYNKLKYLHESIESKRRRRPHERVPYQELIGTRFIHKPDGKEESYVFERNVDPCLFMKPPANHYSDGAVNGGIQSASDLVHKRFRPSSLPEPAYTQNPLRRSPDRTQKDTLNSLREQSWDSSSGSSASSLNPSRGDSRDSQLISSRNATSSPRQQISKVSKKERAFQEMNNTLDFAPYSRGGEKLSTQKITRSRTLPAQIPTRPMQSALGIPRGLNDTFRQHHSDQNHRDQALNEPRNTSEALRPPQPMRTRMQTVSGGNPSKNMLQQYGSSSESPQDNNMLRRSADSYIMGEIDKNSQKHHVVSEREVVGGHRDFKHKLKKAFSIRSFSTRGIRASPRASDGSIRSDRSDEGTIKGPGRPK